MPGTYTLLQEFALSAATSQAVTLASPGVRTTARFISAATSLVDNSVIDRIEYSSVNPETEFTVHFNTSVTGTLQILFSELYESHRRFVGDAGSGGKMGSVPTPATGEAGYILTGAGSWVDPFTVFTGVSGTLVEQTSSFTTTSATYVPVTGMTVTPGAGTYAVWLNGVIGNGSNGRESRIAVFNNGTIITNSERFSEGQANNRSGVASFTVTTVADAQAIDIRLRTDVGGGTAQLENRSVYVVRIGT
jgi:hypothetical protein